MLINAVSMLCPLYSLKSINYMASKSATPQFGHSPCLLLSVIMANVNLSLLIAAVAAFSCVNGQATVITVTNGESDVGARWGPLESCPSGSRVTSYQTTNEVDRPVFDNAALHTIALFCDDPLGTNITSSVGLYVS